MSVSFWFARRYLFSKKSKNAINYITTVSVILIAIVSLALTITMSVFNGLSDIITSMFNQFDPDIKITATSGRVFSLDSVEQKIKSHDEIYAYTFNFTYELFFSVHKQGIVFEYRRVGINFIVRFDFLFYGI